MKLGKTSSAIFQKAFELDNSGIFNSGIYLIDREIYIFNTDNTVLLRFNLLKEKGFESPISFYAKDFEGTEFEEKDGKVIFTSKYKEFTRIKTCSTPELSPAELRTLYENCIADNNKRQAIIITEEVKELLESELSHIEFSGKKGESVLLTQRNIYAGGITEIYENKVNVFRELTEDIGPYGIKTNDFFTLLKFQPQYKFLFPSSVNRKFIHFKGLSEVDYQLTGVIACALFDEEIELRIV